MDFGRQLSFFSRRDVRQEGARFALLVSGAICALSQFENFIPHTVRDSVQKSLSLSNEELAKPDTMFFIMKLIGGVLAGTAYDAGLGRRLIIGSGLVGWSVATSLNAFSHNLMALVVFRAVVGLAEGAVHTTVLPYLADFYLPHERALMFGIIHAMQSIGASLAYIIGGSLAGLMGWRYMYFFCGLPGIILSFSVPFLNDPARGVNDDVDDIALEPFSISNMMHGYLEIVTNPHFVLALAATTSMVFTAVGWHSYLPTYLLRYGGYSVAESGIITGTSSFLGGFCGMLVGAKTVAIAQKSIKNAAFFVSGWYLLWNALCSFFIINVHINFDVLFLLSTSWAFSSAAVVPTQVALSVSTAPAHLRGKAQGFWVLFTTLVGAIPSTKVYGAVADSNGLQASLQMTWVATLFAVVFWWSGYACLPPHQELADEKNTSNAKNSYLSLLYSESIEPENESIESENYGTFQRIVSA